MKKKNELSIEREYEIEEIKNLKIDITKSKILLTVFCSLFADFTFLMAIMHT